MNRFVSTTRSSRLQEFLLKRRVNKLNRQLADQELDQQLEAFLTPADDAPLVPAMIPMSRRNVVYASLAAACGIPMFAIIYGSGTLPS